MSACLACGACCASFRVDFSRDELDEHGGRVPGGLAEELNDALCRMRGTDHLPPRCAALTGRIPFGKMLQNWTVVYLGNLAGSLLLFGLVAASGLLFVIYSPMETGPRYDAALHTFFIGFVFSMIFGHAPVIFPVGFPGGRPPITVDQLRNLAEGNQP